MFVGGLADALGLLRSAVISSAISSTGGCWLTKRAFSELFFVCFKHYEKKFKDVFGIKKKEVCSVLVSGERNQLSQIFHLSSHRTATGILVKEFSWLRTSGELLQGSQVKGDGKRFEDLWIEVEEAANDSSIPTKGHFWKAGGLKESWVQLLICSHWGENGSPGGSLGLGSGRGNGAGRWEKFIGYRRWKAHLVFNY